MGCGSSSRDRFYIQKHLIVGKFHDFDSQKKKCGGMTNILDAKEQEKGQAAFDMATKILNEINLDIQVLKEILDEQKKASGEVVEDSTQNKDKEYDDLVAKSQKESEELAAAAMGGMMDMMGGLMGAMK